MSPLNVFLNFGAAPPLLATSFKVGSRLRVWAARFGPAMHGSLCDADAWGPHTLILAPPTFDQQRTSTCCPVSAEPDMLQQALQQKLLCWAMACSFYIANDLSADVSCRSESAGGRQRRGGCS